MSYPFGELDTLVPAFATTIHKSQGSEYPAVVIPVVTQHYTMLARNLLYTGVTRGKQLGRARRPEEGRRHCSPRRADEAALDQAAGVANVTERGDMTARIRAATEADAEPCGRIIFEAFKGIAEQHAFPLDFPSPEIAIQLAQAFIADPWIFGVVAEKDGRVVGSNFLAEADPIRGVGPITVDPSVQGGGVGRQLMEVVLDRGQDAVGVRLVQDAFNTRSVALYASLGFDVREPLLLMRGTPRNRPSFGL